eukprot:1709021-Rhodomonas_salina.2
MEDDKGTQTVFFVIEATFVGFFTIGALRKREGHANPRCEIRCKAPHWGGLWLRVLGFAGCADTESSKCGAENDADGHGWEGAEDRAVSDTDTARGWARVPAAAGCLSGVRGVPRIQRRDRSLQV